MKKIKVLLSFTLILSMLMCTQAFAVVKYGHKLSRGVSNLCYYVDSTANSYISSINSGKVAWTQYWDDNSIIRMTAVSSTSGSSMDFYGKNSSFFDTDYRSIAAQTAFFNSNSVAVNPNSTNWFYTDVYINRDNMPSASYSRSVIMAHEMGHTLGLDDTNSEVDIMYYLFDEIGSIAYQAYPNMDEYNAVMQIYGGVEVSN